MQDDTMSIQAPSILIVAPNGKLKFAMPCFTSPEFTAQAMVTGSVAALLALAKAKVNTGVIFFKNEKNILRLKMKYMGQ